MITDYFIRSQYYKDMQAGFMFESEGKYDSAKIIYKRCYTLGESFNDGNAMRESKEGIDRCDEALKTQQSKSEVVVQTPQKKFKKMERNL